MEIFLPSILATTLVGAISFVGIFILLNKITKSPKVITALISFAAGALLGDAFLHLLPEYIEEFGFDTNTSLLIFAGVLLMLIIESYFHCSHDSKNELEHHEHSSSIARMNTIGDGLHNFLDGMAIATAFSVSVEVGIATTIAIILHEIPQELADTAVLVYGGWRRAKVLLVNFLTGLTAVAGAIVAFIINSSAEDAHKILIPIAIGQFIYIALADLLPEIHKKSGIKKYIVEIGMFVVGIAIMYAFTLGE